MNEKVIIVDKNDQIIGYKNRLDRSSGDIIRIAGIWIENEKGEVLIAQRSLNKKNDPGKWGPAAAGTLEKGESYELNIIKEVEEEIGVSLQNTDIQFLGAFFEETSHKYFVGTFYTKISSETNFVLQKEEVENVAWISWQDLEIDITEHPDKYLLSLGRGILTRIKEWKKLFSSGKPIKIFNEELLSQNEIDSLKKEIKTRLILLDEGNNIALLYSQKFDYYEIPGGGVDTGETILQGLRREAFEETGCLISDIQELGFTHEVRAAKGTLVVSHGFLARVLGEKAAPHFEQDEIDEGFELLWVSPQKAKMLLAGNVHGDVLYRKYIQERAILFLEKAITLI